MEKHEQSGARTGAFVPVHEPVHVTDVALGVVAHAVASVGVVSRPLQRFLESAARLTLRPPLLPGTLQPATWLTRIGRRGATFRRETLHELVELLDEVVAVTASDLNGHLDLTELIQARVDLVAVAEAVIAGIDLPAIIRDSTSVVASDALLGVRMQSISGDDALGRAVDRLRLRLGRGTAATTSLSDVAYAEKLPVEGSSPSVPQPRTSG